MKLVTIDSREVTGRPGALLDEGYILDLAAAPSTLSESQWVPASVVSILAAGEDGHERVARLIAAAGSADAEKLEDLRRSGVLLPFESTRLLSPLRRPGLVLIVTDDSTGSTEMPPSYIKNPNAVVGTGITVSIPWPSERTVSAHAMIGAVLGKPLSNASADEADAAIAAFTVVIDFTPSTAGSIDSADAWRRYITMKQFPGACPIGPALITREEIRSLEALTMKVSVNGVELDNGPIYGRSESIAELVSRLSCSYGFRPGDLIAIASGGASGPHLLRSGDLFSVCLGDLMETEVTVRF
jgi:2-keto-4-pentenoate hydratase/2-oxohepta-3-ene-1,7-dioic acid hydratase in catechol pathway